VSSDPDEAFPEITEGWTRLRVPPSVKTAGPSARSATFFNPAMRGNRDVTVLFGRAMAREGWRILDALGGTGAKGIRLAVETDLGLQVHINDKSPRAFELVRRNVELNGLDNVTATQKDFFELLARRKFDWIDIDPYGSPVRFVDLAVQRISNGGILSVTATDLAPLCGTNPKTCRRRYHARPLNNGAKHETGLRILVGNIVKRAAVHDTGLVPILAYYHGHYFRAYFEVRKGVRPADTALGSLGFLEWGDGGFTVMTETPRGRIWAGPLWTGNLKHQDVIECMLKTADKATSENSVGLLSRIAEELEQPPFHYHIDELARRFKVEPPRTLDCVKRLNDRGFKASRIHYNPKGFRTNAGFDIIDEVFDSGK
jgi:tRNA (guanine26-N2/guanine27-N2)-dimethyltransferase